MYVERQERGEAWRLDVKCPSNDVGVAIHVLAVNNKCVLRIRRDWRAGGNNHIELGIRRRRSRMGVSSHDSAEERERVNMSPLSVSTADVSTAAAS